jgi:hypothetical protein
MRGLALSRRQSAARSPLHGQALTITADVGSGAPRIQLSPESTRSDRASSARRRDRRRRGPGSRARRSLRRGASVVLHGAEAVAAHTINNSGLHTYIVPALVNGTAGAVIAPHGEPYSVMAFIIINGKITTIDALLDPERLEQLDLPLPPSREQAD